MTAAARRRRPRIGASRRAIPRSSARSTSTTTTTSPTSRAPTCRRPRSPSARTATCIAYEAINLVDGKRSISEIRDILTGRYDPVPLPEVAEYFELLAKAGAVRLSP